uniref:Tryptophan dimethylallyltransferase n=3 Tax=Epichloe TaxID=5112 RepID=A0A3G1K0I8_9HYPO|nr:dimethylallyl tryptophan synthase [Epichloe bromicola]
MAKTLHQEVYQTLSEIFDFANNDQRLWWHSTAPMFERILQAANYSIHAQYRHLGIYKRHIIPFLGVYPTRSGERWLSILTRYGTPFELSLNCSDSIVRYTYEPINAATGSHLDPFNTFAIWEALKKLMDFQPGIDLEWFSYFKQELTLDANESTYLHSQNLVKEQIKTQNKLALDLKGDKFVLKTYIYPELKSVATGKSVQELVFGSVRKLAQKHKSICSAFEILEDYVQSRNEVSTTDGSYNTPLSSRLLSCDLMSPTKSRIKIYLLERMVSLPAMEDLWTLGGRRKDQSTIEGLEMIRELWGLLNMSPGLHAYPEPYLPLGAVPNERLPSMANYTLHHNDPMPEPQVYFTVFSMNDMEVTNALTTFFMRHEWSDMAREYKASLRESFPHDDYEALNYIHSYISFSYRKNKPYLSVYLHSFETGDWPVFPDSPTAFDACRRDSTCYRQIRLWQ